MANNVFATFKAFALSLSIAIFLFPFFKKKHVVTSIIFAYFKGDRALALKCCGIICLGSAIFVIQVSKRLLSVEKKQQDDLQNASVKLQGRSNGPYEF